jgi:hypothetical protein
MPDYDYDIYAGEGDEQLSWEEYFEDILGGDAVQNPDSEWYGSEDMYTWLEENPWEQWGGAAQFEGALGAGFTLEDWEAGLASGDITPGMEDGTYVTPDYWLYEDIGDDDPYMSLEDLIYEVTEGEAGYSEIFGGDAPGEVGLEYGTGVDSIYGLYMDEFFEFNPETGSFESRYDPLEFEKQERFKLKQGQEKLVSDIEGLSGKYRQEYGRGLGVDTLDIGDIASIIDPQSETLQGEYGFGVEESELAYLDDMLGEFAQMTLDATWLDPDL